jgi:putative spermidine/putrescine transport system substrate-binding protein
MGSGMASHDPRPRKRDPHRQTGKECSNEDEDPGSDLCNRCDPDRLRRAGADQDHLRRHERRHDGKNYTASIFPDFEKANNVKVVVVPGTSSDIIAKMQAQRDKPQMHVAFLDDGIMYRAINMSLCEKVKDAAVLKDVYPFARLANDQAVAIEMGVLGIGYNKKLFAEKGWPAPTSWMDFADPKYKQKVVFQSISASTFGLYGFMMFNRLVGGTDKNVDPGFKKWGSTVGPNVVEYLSSSAKISEMVQTNEAAIFPLTVTGIANLKDKGIPPNSPPPRKAACC